MLEGIGHGNGKWLSKQGELLCMGCAEPVIPLGEEIDDAQTLAFDKKPQCDKRSLRTRQGLGNDAPHVVLIGVIDDQMVLKASA